MKTILMTIILAATTAAFANKPASRGSTLKTRTNSSSVSRTNSSTTLRNFFNPNERVGSASKNFHFMTNMVGLYDGNTNVQANFFGFPQVALSVHFQQALEKDEPIRKSVFEPGSKVAVTTIQFGVGAAYYVWPINQKFNVMVNPYFVSEKKSDPINVDNATGLGLKADGMMRVENFAFNLGAQYTSPGESSTLVNAAVGYIF